MSPYRFPLALLTFFGIVGITPVWIWFVSNYTPSLSPPSQFIAGLTLPGFVLLYLGSWLTE